MNKLLRNFDFVMNALSGFGDPVGNWYDGVTLFFGMKRDLQKADQILPFYPYTVMTYFGKGGKKVEKTFVDLAIHIPCLKESYAVLLKKLFRGLGYPCFLLSDLLMEMSNSSIVIPITLSRIHFLSDIGLIFSDYFLGVERK